jgi:hypothetical protein
MHMFYLHIELYLSAPPQYLCFSDQVEQEDELRDLKLFHDVVHRQEEGDFSILLNFLQHLFSYQL